MGQKFLMDTNVALDYLGNVLPAKAMKFVDGVVDATPAISVISRIELLGFVIPEKEEKRIREFVGDCMVYDLSESIVEQTISIRKTKRIKLPDAVIAATAIESKLTLLTRNIRDFKGIKGLDVLNPYEL